MMEDIEFGDRFIYIPSSETLCISDAHFGRHRRTGSFSPPEPVDPLLEERLISLLDNYNPQTIIFNGDTYTAVNPSDESINTVSRLEASSDATFIFTEGNHDSLDILNDIGIGDTMTKYDKGRFCFTHGHKNVSTNAEYLVIGHVHPATLIDGEIQPCFVRMKSPRQTIIALPVFNHTASCEDIQHKPLEKITPFLQKGRLEYMPINSEEGFRELK